MNRYLLLIIAFASVGFNLGWNRLFNHAGKPEPRKFQEKWGFILSPLEKLKVKPNYLTILGLLVGWTAGYFFLKGWDYAFLIFFLISGMIDGIDGLLARKTNQVTRLGTFLDSFSDYSTRALIMVCLFWRFGNFWSFLAAVFYLFYIGVLILYKRKGKEMLYWYHCEFLFFLTFFLKENIVLPIFISELVYLPLIMKQLVEILGVE